MSESQAPIRPIKLGAFAARLARLLAVSPGSAVASKLLHRKSWPTEQGLSLIAPVRLYQYESGYYLAHVAEEPLEGAVEINTWNDAELRAVAAYFDHEYDFTGLLVTRRIRLLVLQQS